jgi:stringent starvation protein B
MNISSKLMSLNASILDAHYSYVANNNIGRLDVLVKATYLNPGLRTTLEKYTCKHTDIVVLNIGVAAARNITYTGNSFHADVRIDGVPIHLDIPFHAFEAARYQLHDRSVFSTFPELDRIQYHAVQPQIQNRDSHNQIEMNAPVSIDLDKVYELAIKDGFTGDVGELVKRVMTDPAYVEKLLKGAYPAVTSVKRTSPPATQRWTPKVIQGGKQ